MNLQKLFQTQKVLRDRIGYEGEDRFEKLILALLVEIGECANEFRGFKFWSKDQKPRTELIHRDPHGQCADVVTNPLLEEYVDGLHFLLELGLELNYTNMLQSIMESETIECQFNDVFNGVCYLRVAIQGDWGEVEKQEAFEALWADFWGLGIMLGFTWEEIEAAYFEKNKINHERQNTGY
ncbi:dUTP diphosphatase [Niallia sp. RD1]|uniref:dUTP diphosphatase n=1 Tax=Niallia sp. RD1 TaxID=2962858 RepID=UPI0020C1B713|nr:dUTP diphosphatase [Niallia sp. RD1]UTI44419.1 dUTP diphosphatase [Niallia sp. RD1]